MNRDDVVGLLRLRYQLTDQRFGDDTVDAWHELLERVDPLSARRALKELVRGGAIKVACGQLAERCAPPVTRSTETPPDDEPVASPERTAYWLAKIRADADARRHRLFDDTKGRP